MHLTPQMVRDFVGELAPWAAAEEWDNPGLLVDTGAPVSGILVSLDITGATLAEAQERGCNLMVSHHPVIFHPLKRIGPGDMVARMLEAGVSALCAHTNYDVAVGGVNDVLAGLLGLQNTEPFIGMGRVGSLPQLLSAQELAALCVKQLGAPVQVAGDKAAIHRVAVLGGSGRHLVAEAVAAGADALVTGEASHDDALLAAHCGAVLVAAGHYATERPAMQPLAQKLQAAFEVPVHLSICEADPFCWVGPQPI